MRKFITWTYALVVAGVVAPVSLPAVAADAGDILVRLRGVAFLPDTGGAADDGPTNIGGTASKSDTYIPELDITYFITKNIAAELILATTRHEISVDGSTLGNVHLGQVSLLPPVLSLQYHFLPDNRFRPYVGAGVNYTIMFDEDRGRGGGGASIDNITYSNELGYAFQVGIDMDIKGGWFLNADLKKVFVSTDISINDGAIKADDIELDPWIFGIGVGFRF